MPAYKAKNGKGWYVKFRIYDRQNKMKYVTKRGFATKRDALEFENNLKLASSGSSAMKFKVNGASKTGKPNIKFGQLGSDTQQQ